MLRSTLLVCAALTFCAACEKTPSDEAAEQVAPHREKAAARIASLKQASAEMRKAPRLTKDGLALGSGPALIGKPDAYGDFTAAVIYEEDLADVESQNTKAMWAIDSSGLYGLCATILKDPTKTPLHLVGQVAKNCAAARYAVLLRTYERIDPVLNKDELTFVPGHHKGEVQVWDLDTRKNVGGFRFNIVNDEYVKGRGSVGPYDLQNDLKLKLEVALEQRLAGNVAAAPP